MRSKKWSIVLSTAMLVSLLGASVSAEEIQQEGTQFQVSVVHTNDIHARVQMDERNQVLGLGRVKALADQRAQESDEVLVLDAGDYFHGQSIATMVQGESVARLMGACGYDAMTPGNHDWSYGKNQLKNLGQIAAENSSSEFAVLGGNIITDSGEQFFDTEYLVKEVEKDGQTLKIGMFGVIDPKVYHSTAPANVEGLEFTDMEAYAKEASEELEEMGCQIVIGLTHSYEPTELAKEVDGVDLWIAGHEHLGLNETVTTPDGGSALVVETGYYLWTIGDVEIACTLDEEGNVVSLDMEENMVGYEEGTQIVSDEGIEELIAEINEEQKPILEQKVGYTPEELDGVWEHVRTGETTLGRVITSAYRLETGADVAFENAGGIRASIESGDVTYQEVLDVSPYGNYVVTKSLTGADLLSMMETSLDIMKQSIAADEAGDYDGWPEHSGSVLQMSGMKIQYDMDREKGSRIIDAQIQGQKIDPQKEYIAAMNNYAATDTDTYPELAGKDNVHEYGACEDILAAYLSQDESAVLEGIQTAWFAEYEDTEKPEEPENPEKPEQPGDSGNNGNQDQKPADKPGTGNGNKTQGGSPKTGDTANVWPLLAVMLTSGAVVCVNMKKRRYE